MLSRTALAVCLVALCLHAPASAARLGPQAHSGLPGQETNDPMQTQVEVLDADARIYLYRNFLSEEECDYLRLKAEKRLERSGVVDSNTGGSEVSDIRTSDGMFFGRAEDHVIEAVERRVAQFSLTPVHNGEGLQVLRYRLGQKYDAHWDWFFDAVNTENGGNRWATVLMYLADVEEGGETVFPKLPAPGGENVGFSECARYNLAVKPRKGDALLFHSMTPVGQLEERSMHGACPVIKGEKWSMTKWIHAGQYRMHDKFDVEADEAAETLRQYRDAPNHHTEF